MTKLQMLSITFCIKLRAGWQGDLWYTRRYVNLEEKDALKGGRLGRRYGYTWNRLSSGNTIGPRYIAAFVSPNTIMYVLCCTIFYGMF
jgi:hypothetical protein